MTPLHLTGPESSGGATAVARHVQALVGGTFYAPSATPIQQAWRTIAGMRSHKAEWEMVWEIRRQRPDLIHLHNFKAIGTAAIAAARRELVPVVWSCYDLWPLCPRDNLYTPDGPCDGQRSCLACYRPKGGHWPRVANLALLGRRWRILRWINRLDGVIALSEHSRQLLRRHGVQVPIHVVPPPVVVPNLALEAHGMWTASRCIADHAPRLVWAGWLAPNKGIEVFLQACAEGRAVLPAMQCVAFGLVADPAYAARVALRADLVGVHLVADLPAAAMPHEALLREVARADVLVCTEQWSNPYPVIVAEAVALGVPVVASRIGGIPELLPAECLATPTDPKAFAVRILAGLRDGFPDPPRLWTTKEIKAGIAHAYEAAERNHGRRK